MKEEYRYEIFTTYVLMAACLVLMVFAVKEYIEPKYFNANSWIMAVIAIYLAWRLVSQIYYFRRKMLAFAKYKSLKEFIHKEILHGD